MWIFFRKMFHLSNIWEQIYSFSIQYILGKHLELHIHDPTFLIEKNAFSISYNLFNYIKFAVLWYVHVVWTTSSIVFERSYKTWFKTLYTTYGGTCMIPLRVNVWYKCEIAIVIATLFYGSLILLPLDYWNVPSNLIFIDRILTHTYVTFTV